MKLTPMDISNKEFKKSFRGYDSDEVDEFINEIIENYEELYKENSRLKENLSRVNEKLEHYVKIENTIQNTLLLAQNAAEQARDSSQKESDLIIRNANETAKRVLDKAHNDVISINDEYEKVKQDFIKFRAKFRNFMNAQTETFDELEKDLIKNYNVLEPVKEVKIDTIELTNKNIEEIEEFNDDISEIKSFFAEKITKKN